MRQIKIFAPETVDTTISLPASKSLCNRALVINALSVDRGTLLNLSDCDDTSVMIKALRNMPVTIDIKAAGTAMRFLTSYLAVTEGSHVLTGTERMCNRPIRVLVEALRKLGADISYEGKEGFPPLRINGRLLTGGRIHLPGNISSQYISSLLMISPTLKNGLTIALDGEIVSRPYIDMTLQLMNKFGAKAEWISDHEISVPAQIYNSKEYVVENDWSAASYWYEIAALSPRANIRLPGLFARSLQGDAHVADLFEFLGVHTTFAEDEVCLQKSGHCVKRFEYDFVNQPDLAQTLVVTCALLGIPFRFTGLQSLKIKETDRITALITEMKKLGYVVSEENGSILKWNGEMTTMEDVVAIDTYEDHRMAMAFAPAALRFDGLLINDPQVVSKSYPDYWKNLGEAGFMIIEQ